MKLPFLNLIGNPDNQIIMSRGIGLDKWEMVTPETARVELGLKIGTSVKPQAMFKPGTVNCKTFLMVNLFRPSLFFFWRLFYYYPLD
ncbi:MAG: hypothetical protein CM1200mP10_16460 [Candidatus Neomarinimicrobiota bacterium]|nr:MAG: hypothetical protein CM1200mP10_16460 [Candidatus Neomarinimicrobiota bacterium]